MRTGEGNSPGLIVITARRTIDCSPYQELYDYNAKVSDEFNLESHLAFLVERFMCSSTGFCNFVPMVIFPFSAPFPCEEQAVSGNKSVRQDYVFHSLRICRPTQPRALDVFQPQTCCLLAAKAGTVQFWCRLSLVVGQNRKREMSVWKARELWDAPSAQDSFAANDPSFLPDLDVSLSIQCSRGCLCIVRIPERPGKLTTRSAMSFCEELPCPCFDFACKH